MTSTSYGIPRDELNSLVGSPNPSSHGGAHLDSARDQTSRAQYVLQTPPRSDQQTELTLGTPSVGTVLPVKATNPMAALNCSGRRKQRRR